MSSEMRLRPVRLHVSHDLGGGSAKWLRDFVEADVAHHSLVLRSFTIDNNAGGGLALFDGNRDARPAQRWWHSEPIAAAAVANAGYGATLARILDEHRVGEILVSSLIGHSLEVLETSLPTIVVCHDYFPYCPAIHLYFGEVCSSCGTQRLAQCHDTNRRFNAFQNFPPEQRARLRERYLQLVARPNVRLVAPSRSVVANLSRLNPRFGQIEPVVIPHGYGHPLSPVPGTPPSDRERLRILVLGQLSVAKGVELLQAAAAEISKFADLYLLGCGEVGELFRYEPHVHVVRRYEIGDLPVHVANINPHVAVLASIVAETFSYTLSELSMLGVPAAATRLGSFEERIRHGHDGYLFEPTAAAMIRALREIDADRATLSQVRARLAGWRPRSPLDMVSDYERIVPRAPDLPPGPIESPSPSRGESSSVPDELLVDMWKETRRLHTELAVALEARENTQKQLTLEVGRTRELAREHAQQAAALRESREQLERVGGLLHLRNLQIAEIHASTSWKLSRPVRWAGRGARRLRLLGAALGTMARRPNSWPVYARDLFRASRREGIHGLKKALLALQPNETLQRAWEQYRKTFADEVRPRIVEAIGRMERRPLISVIVPVYNTPEPMLSAMLESVRDQLYPEWQLCLADDGSTKPHVKRMLESATSRDPRVHVHFGERNRGVAHASNRALEMATGELAVLLDHDDQLEEQALFRMAQAIVEDEPDVVYSDEALFAGDGSGPKELVYRPAFSPEFLRGHPYIVHLAGYRTALLREIGGFDESLDISQDYDLVLRATEKARRVVHIPEILYRWRIHGSSAGHQKMGRVMQTSQAILERHLERCGEAGHVEPGAGFNFFDPRYPLAADLRVAIVIPTKNHGGLLRQCIESIERTTRVSHEIVVVDHESDDPSTLAYLASLGDAARVLRYTGPFNFSAINNWAVARLAPGYTHVLFLNNDVEAITEGWLERMLELGQRRSIGIVGAKLLYPDRRTIQHAGVCVGAFRGAEHYAKFVQVPPGTLQPGYLGALVVNREVSAVTAACMLASREALEATGGFEESIAVGFGDVDLCLRVIAKGYRVLFCPHAELIHHESMTRGTASHDPHPEDTALYRRKWKALLEAGDPFYNPGLSLSSTTWAIKQPLWVGYDIRRRLVSRDPDTGLSRVLVDPA